MGKLSFATLFLLLAILAGPALAQEDAVSNGTHISLAAVIAIVVYLIVLVYLGFLGFRL